MGLPITESTVTRCGLPRVTRVALALQVRRCVRAALDTRDHVVNIGAPCLVAFSAHWVASQDRCSDALPFAAVTTSSCTGADVFPLVQLTPAVAARPAAFRARAWRSCGQPGSWMRKSGTAPRREQCRRDSGAARAGSLLSTTSRYFRACCFASDSFRNAYNLLLLYGTDRSGLLVPVGKRRKAFRFLAECIP